LEDGIEKKTKFKIKKEILRNFDDQGEKGFGIYLFSATIEMPRPFSIYICFALPCGLG